MQYLRQNTQGTWKAGPFLDETSGTGTVTSLTITPDLVRLSKNGGNYAAKAQAGTAAHDESGFYDIIFGTGDADTLGRLRAMVHSGALPVWDEFQVIEETKYDWLFGTNDLDVGTAQNVLSIPGVGTVDLAISVGTADSVNSIPSVGTVDYVVNAGTLIQSLARPEPGQGQPGTTIDAFLKTDYLYKAWVNPKMHNGTNFRLFSADGSTVDQTSFDFELSGTAWTGSMASGA